MEDLSKFRKFKVGNWASFKNATMNWEKGKITKIIPASNGQTIAFIAYVYDSIENEQLVDSRSQVIDLIPLTPNLLPNLGFEKIDDVTYKKGKWKLINELNEGAISHGEFGLMSSRFFSLTDGYIHYPTVSEVHTLQNIIGDC